MASPKELGCVMPRKGIAVGSVEEINGIRNNTASEKEFE
jgi:hypothetical protein